MYFFFNFCGGIFCCFFGTAGSFFHSCISIFCCFFYALLGFITNLSITCAKRGKHCYTYDICA